MATEVHDILDNNEIKIELATTKEGLSDLLYASSCIWNKKSSPQDLKALYNKGLKKVIPLKILETDFYNREKKSFSLNATDLLLIASYLLGKTQDSELPVKLLPPHSMRCFNWVIATLEYTIRNTTSNLKSQMESDLLKLLVLKESGKFI